MNRLPAEVKGLITSWLNTEDACSLRLVNNAFSMAAADYILPHVHFFMHRGDLTRLQSVATHPLLAKRVKSLTYFTHRFRRLSFHKMVTEHLRKAGHGPGAPFLAIQEWQRNYPASKLPDAHGEYCRLVEDQVDLINKRYDISILESALPKLVALQSIYVGRIFHSQNEPFYSDGRPYLFCGRPGSYFDGRCWARRWATRESILVEPDYEPLFASHAALKAVLEALSHTDLEPREIHTSVHWAFFHLSLEEVSTLFRPLTKASVVELHLTIAAPQVANNNQGSPFIIDSPPHCSTALARAGVLRAILQSMKSLEDLRFSFQEGKPNTTFFIPITLGMVIAPGFRWHNLANLALANIRCSRQALWQVLELHKDTLTVLHLQEITLEKWGSWRKLLPDIRNQLNLQHACFTKYLRGYTTEDDDTALPEEIFLGFPQLRHAMRESINCYCRRGGTEYPDELPLTYRVVLRNFDEYVRDSESGVDQVDGIQEEYIEAEGWHEGEDEERRHVVAQFTFK